ncbi:hypothetical protein BKA70DRAFT_1228941 [Coprinopsis sp. MPI-PUGE-AT-0042]|nr:hypothetical protein BKA70DRAFT_1228941 [Coprinopsis sp. MPI-PUGE-AT-0042]
MAQESSNLGNLEGPFPWVTEVDGLRRTRRKGAVIERDQDVPHTSGLLQPFFVVKGDTLKAGAAHALQSSIHPNSDHLSVLRAGVGMRKEQVPNQAQPWRTTSRVVGSSKEWADFSPLNPSALSLLAPCLVMDLMLAQHEFTLSWDLDISLAENLKESLGTQVEHVKFDFQLVSKNKDIGSELIESQRECEFDGLPLGNMEQITGTVPGNMEHGIGTVQNGTGTMQKCSKGSSQEHSMETSEVNFWAKFKDLIGLCLG